MDARAAKKDYREFLKLSSLFSSLHFFFYFIKVIKEEGEKESHESNLYNNPCHGKVQRHKITGPRLQHLLKTLQINKIYLGFLTFL